MIPGRMKGMKKILGVICGKISVAWKLVVLVIFSISTTPHLQKLFWLLCFFATGHKPVSLTYGQFPEGYTQVLLKIKILKI